MKIPILRAGQTATGKIGVIRADDEMLGAMAARYNPRRHEAPIIIGPRSDTAPAFGWIQSVMKEGSILFAEADVIYDSVAEDIRNGTRRVEKAGFYQDMGLRHVVLSGTAPAIPGMEQFFMGDPGWITFEFNEKGGMNSMDMNDPRMKAFLRLGDEIYCGLQPKQFSEEDNPGEILHRKTMDIMMNPPRFDKYGREITGKFDYRQAYALACEQNPDLAARYIQQIEDTRFRSMKTTFSR